MFATGISRNVTESDVFRAIGDFITSIFAGQTLQGQANRVSPPQAGTWFVVMTPLFISDKSTNRTSYDADKQTQTVTRTAVWTMQIDCYGENTSSLADTLAMLFRSEYACDYFREHNPLVTPLYASEVRQTNFVNNHDQYEGRWSFDIKAQVNAAVTMPQQFMTGVTLKLTNVDSLIQ